MHDQYIWWISAFHLCQKFSKERCPLQGSEFNMNAALLLIELVNQPFHRVEVRSSPSAPKIDVYNLATAAVIR
ncbi:hypothetical protein D3C77_740350 [compost metagenome]